MTEQRDQTDHSIEIAAGLLEGRVSRDAPLGILTTYRVGGSASLLMTVETEDDLTLVSEAIQRCEVSVLIVGRGSNMLVADTGYRGLAIILGESFAIIARSQRGPNTLVEVDAGGATALPVLARRCVSEGLVGLEWAVGVPGSVGGAVAMNAGGHGSEVANVLQRVHLFDLVQGENKVVPAEDLALGYRCSNLGRTTVVLGATFGLEQGDREQATRELEEIVRWRRANQPGGQNAGSVFTNPPGESAGRLIEVAGCKGLRMGSAEVSTKHANFIQADPGGSANDVAMLIGEVQNRVELATGVRLVPEVRMIGFTDDVVASARGE